MLEETTSGGIWAGVLKQNFYLDIQDKVILMVGVTEYIRTLFLDLKAVCMLPKFLCVRAEWTMRKEITGATPAESVMCAWSPT